MSDRCPVDGSPVVPDPRYPGLLCESCSGRATDIAERPVGLHNTSMSGGFVALHRDDGSACAQVTDDHVVLVDGRRCRADEGRFGGTVVQLAAD